MAKLNISVKYDDITVKTKEQKAVLNINDLIVVGGNGSASINRHTHTQTTPATQWTINHNLGVQPQISVLSKGGMLMLAEILHISTNQAIIYFDNPTAGIANCI